MTETNAFIEAMMHEYDWADVSDSEYVVITDGLLNSWDECYGNVPNRQKVLRIYIDVVKNTIALDRNDLDSSYGKNEESFDVLSTVEALAFLLHMRTTIQPLSENNDEAFLMDITDFTMTLDVMRHVLDSYIDRKNIDECTEFFNDGLAFVSSNPAKSLVKGFMNALRGITETIDNNDRKMA